MTAFTTLIRHGLPVMLVALGLSLTLPVQADPSEKSKGKGNGNGNSFVQHNLVSSQAGVADHQDPDLVNAWGVAFNPNGFVWVADNGTGLSTLYDGNGVKNSLIVTIPVVNGTAPGVPTGITFSSSNDFQIPTPTGDAASRFLFATEDGGIFGWAPGLTVAVQKVPAAGVITTAVYKGIAVAGNGTGHQIYAADFHNKKIDVFDATFNPVGTTGGFVDPNIPSSFGPFNIMNINGDLYVAYAMKETDGDDEVAGQGLGFVDAFTADGVLIRRIATRGNLNAPWGMAIAPISFGRFGNALLVGNFGDGTINAFDLKNGTSLGQLRNANNQVLAIDGLWGIAFGNGILNQPADVLFFAAGPAEESEGLYGFLTPAPTSSEDDGGGH
jgi:uncharacterized protein (TIGR03118 family)